MLFVSYGEILTMVMKILLLLSFQKSYRFSFYVWDYDPFQVNFCVWSKIRSSTFVFPPVALVLFLEKTIYLPLNNIAIFVKKKASWPQMCEFVSGFSIHPTENQSHTFCITVCRLQMNRRYVLHVRYTSQPWPPCQNCFCQF